MRIATFTIDGPPRPGLVPGDPAGAILDLTAAAELSGGGGAPRDVMAIIQAWSADLAGRFAAMLKDASPRAAQVGRSGLKLCAPVERPGKIICLAGNYRAHITESGFVAPDPSATVTPQLFLKPATALTGDGDDIRIGRNNGRVGWEVELAVVIGKRGRDIPARDAYGHVFGYTILNDISERRLNAQIVNRRERERDPFFDWLAGKWFDSFAPCGPWIVTADEVADPHDLEIRLWVNGQLRQRGHTGEMIFRIPEIVAYASGIMTLEPGDLISTGTPVGAGVGGAGTSLRAGDEVVCEVEGIGTLRNQVRFAG